MTRTVLEARPARAGIDHAWDGRNDVVTGGEADVRGKANPRQRPPVFGPRQEPGAPPPGLLGQAGCYPLLVAGHFHRQAGGVARLGAGVGAGQRLHQRCRHREVFQGEAASLTRAGADDADLFERSGRADYGRPVDQRTGEDGCPACERTERARPVGGEQHRSPIR